MLSQAPKLIRQLSTDPRLDAEIKTEAQQVFIIALYLKYDWDLKYNVSSMKANEKGRCLHHEILKVCTLICKQSKILSEDDHYRHCSFDT